MKENTKHIIEINGVKMEVDCDTPHKFTPN